MHYVLTVFIPTNAINTEQYITKRMAHYADKWQRYNINASLHNDTIPDAVLTPDGNWHERLLWERLSETQRAQWVNQVEAMRVRYFACEQVIVDCQNH